MRSTNPLSTDDQITISMASMPSRVEGMCATVRKLLPYCDNFDLCLNGYHKQPVLPDDSKLTIIQEHPIVGARGKFYLNHRTPGYHLTVDDDIEYPEDYVRVMIQHIERYERAAIIGMHGQLLTYPNGRIVLQYDQTFDRDWPMHILGTGVMGYHSSVLPIAWDSMLPGKIDDQVAWYAQETATPMILIAHETGWIQDREELSLVDSLRRNLEARRIANARVLSRQWRLHYPQL